MPNYKIGDIASLFPSPKEPTSESGKKLQSLFKDFYSQNKGKNKFTPQQQDGMKNKKLFGSEKKVKRLESTEDNGKSNDTKGKKRKFQDLDNSLSNVTNNKFKKMKYVENEFQPSAAKANDEIKNSVSNVSSSNFKKFKKRKSDANKAQTFVAQGNKNIENSLPSVIKDKKLGKFQGNELQSPMGKVSNEIFSNIPNNKSKKFKKVKSWGDKFKSSEEKVNDEIKILSSNMPNNESKKFKKTKPHGDKFKNSEENIDDEIQILSSNIPYNKSKKFKKVKSHRDKFQNPVGKVSDEIEILSSDISNNKSKKFIKNKSHGDKFQNNVAKVSDNVEFKSLELKSFSAEEEYFPRTKKAMKRKLGAEQEISKSPLSEIKTNSNTDNMTQSNTTHFIKNGKGKCSNDLEKSDNNSFPNALNKKLNDDLQDISHDSKHKKSKPNKEKRQKRKSKSLKNKNDANQIQFPKFPEELKLHCKTTKSSEMNNNSYESNEEDNDRKSDKSCLLKSGGKILNSSANVKQKILESNKKMNAKKFKNGETLSLDKKDNFRKVPGMKNRKSFPVTHTLFVANLPLNITKKALEKLFNPFGPLENVRIRGVVPSKQTLSKRIAAIKQDYHRNLHCLKAFVVFKEEKSIWDALQLNGSIFEGHHIVVDRAQLPGQKIEYDTRRSIFIGNLPFDVEDEAIWSIFSKCGPVQNVRIIRDRDTGVSKGFGYVLFNNIDSKESALQLKDVKIDGRDIRIQATESKERNTKKKKKTLKRMDPDKQCPSLKWNALKYKCKMAEGNSKKTIKKIMKKQTLAHKKKQIATFLQKKKSE